MRPNGATKGNDAGGAPMERARDLAAVVAPPLIVLVLVLGAWAMLSITVYGEKNFLVPRPWQVLDAGWVNRSELLEAFWITFQESAVGFAAAIVVGLTGAIIMSQSKALERSLYPYAILLQTTPIVAVAPILVLWFGFEQRSVMMASFIIALFPIVNNALLGLLSTDRNQVDLFRLHHASRGTQLLKLRLPGAMPSIIAGMRISAGLAVVGAIVGEFIIGAGGTDGGLGVKIVFAQARLDTDLMFAEVMLATVLGLCFFTFATFVGWLSLRHWHESALKADV